MSGPKYIAVDGGRLILMVKDHPSRRTVTIAAEGAAIGMLMESISMKHAPVVEMANTVQELMRVTPAQE